MASKKTLFDWLVVSVTGATGGGKSELSTYLYKNLPHTCRLLRQDDYFLPEDSPKHVVCSDVVKHFNWDVVTALDMDKMFSDVQEIISNPPSFREKGQIRYTNMATNVHSSSDVHNPEVSNALAKVADACGSLSRPILLLDGFCLLDDLSILQVSELTFFFELSKEECLRRRGLRTFDPPDVPGYFEVCVWPMYEQYRDRCHQLYRHQTNLVFLSEDYSVPKIHNVVLSHLTEACNPNR